MWRVIALQTLLTEGSDWKKPNQGAKITAHLVGRLQDGSVLEDGDREWVTDEGAQTGAHAGIFGPQMQRLLAGTKFRRPLLATKNMQISLTSHHPSGEVDAAYIMSPKHYVTQIGNCQQSKCRRGWTWRCRR